MSESINIFKYRLREYIFDKKQQVDILWLPTGVGRSVICFSHEKVMKSIHYFAEMWLCC